MNACVQVRVSGQIRIVPFVEARDRQGNRCIRRAKQNLHEGIRLNFCPVCGQRLVTAWAKVWHEADGTPVS